MDYQLALFANNNREDSLVFSSLEWFEDMGTVKSDINNLYCWQVAPIGTIKEAQYFETGGKQHTIGNIIYC